MKIGIPVDGKTLDTYVCPSYGRAPFCLIYDTTTDAHTFHVNEAADRSGGVGVLAAQFYVDQGVDAVITPRMGKNAADVLVAAKIEIFLTDGNDLRHNIESMKANQLKPLTNFHGGFHGAHQ